MISYALKNYEGKFLMKLLSLIIILFLSGVLPQAAVLAQGNVPCDGSLYFTRQIDGSTRISAVTVGAGGNVAVADPLTLHPNKSTNATGYYNGYVYTVDWAPNTFTLVRIENIGAGFEVNNSTSTATVSGMPNGMDPNNAAIDKNGIMYIFSGGAQADSRLYKIDLKNWPTLTSTNTTYTITGNTENRLWGDVAFDPITGDAYAWYHPSTATARGLYRISNITGTPVLTKVAAITTNYIIGSLFFNERGQLFGYGTPVGGSGEQTTFYYIDKTTGEVTLLGSSQSSPQSDGCECSYRLSLTVTSGRTGNGTVDIPQCSVPNEFGFTFKATNTAVGSFTGINFRFPIDGIRFAFANSLSELKTYFDAQFPGSDVTVSLDDPNAGELGDDPTVTTVLFVEDITVAGAGVSGAPVESDFTVNVRVATGGDAFAEGEKVGFQARFGGMSALYGESENSTDPNADPSDVSSGLFSKQATEITFTKSDACDRSISGNVWHDTSGDAVYDGTEGAIQNGLIYANLTTEAGYVIVSVPVINGAYSFTGLPRGNYKVVLSSSAQTEGTILTTSPIPAWAATGTNTPDEGANTSNNTNVISVDVEDDPIVNIDFGMQQPPVATDNSSSPTLFGTNATIPTIANDDSDHEDVTIDPTTISLVVPVGAQTVIEDLGRIKGFTVPGEGTWTVDNDGNVTFTPLLELVGNPTPIKYTVEDILGFSSNEATLEVDYYVNISGKVWDDTNGNAVSIGENPVSGDESDDNSGNSVTAGGDIYANLVDENGEVVASVQVGNDGTYNFTNVAIGEEYKVILTETVQTVSSPLADNEASIPEGWVATGTNVGGTASTSNKTNTISLGVVNTNVTADFGINERPEADDVNGASVLNPGGTDNRDITTGFFDGQDFSGGELESITITSFPTNATSIRIGAVTYYEANEDLPETCPTTTCEVWSTPVTVALNGDKDPNETVSIDPVDGDVTVVVSYTYTDNAGLVSNVGSLQLPFTTSPLPVKMLYFSAVKKVETVELTWATASEQNNTGFYVERSSGGAWSTLGFVSTKAENGNSSSTIEYSYTDAAPVAGANQYRLRQVDIDGKFTISDVRQVSFDGGVIGVYPNPVSGNEITISGLSGTNKIVITNLSGQVVSSQTVSDVSVKTINVSKLAVGTYVVSITDNNGNKTNHKLVKQ